MRISCQALLSCLWLASVSLPTIHGFSLTAQPRYSTTASWSSCALSASNDDHNDNEGGEEDDPKINDNTAKPVSSSEDRELKSALESRVNEIQVEKTRAALEEAHTKSFLKRRPRKLSYQDARVWVQANLGCDTKEEFYDLVANGNLRTPYIPKQPEKYYKETREWVSWDHFLRGCFDNRKPSAVKPSTGVFD